MKIRTPQEIGLPEHITEWRPGQEEFIDAIFTDRTRFTALCSGTGTGKTAGYMAAAVESGKPTCIVTNSKGLQDQLLKDYSPLGLVDIRGRVNYTCDMRQGYTCQDGYVANCPYKNTPGCPSSHAEMKASVSKLVVTNYDKWIAAKKYSTGMSHFDQVFFDESHAAPTALAKAMQTELNHHEIEDVLHLEFPAMSARDTIGGWKQWAAETRETVEAEMKMADLQIKSTSSPKLSWIKHYHHMKELVKRLATIATAAENNWVVEEVPGGYQFDPIFPGRYVEGILFFNIPKIVFISATIRPKTMSLLGIKKALYQFHEFPSDFDPNMGPVYWIPTMDGGYENRNDMTPMWNRHDQIASRRQDRNGIDHTVSYSRQSNLIAHSRFSHMMIEHVKGKPVDSFLERFRGSYPGAILVSPSVSTGYDFPDSQCEWQFISNIPFIPGQSKVIKARQHLDNEYKPYHAMLSFVQMCGRGNRSRKDRCETFIGDNRCEWFIPRYSHLAPKGFIGKSGSSFFRRINTLPAPPPRLGQ